MGNLNPKTARRQKRHRRIRAQVVGTADKPRLSVYRSNKHMYAQLIDDVAGETLVSASSLELKLDESLMEAAELVGKTIAERGSKAGIEEVVFDRGGYNYTGRIETLAEAARANGLTF
ncbi:MAG: 50S ribosomal protein L18 [Candidatus Paceibacterota bacterium]